MGLRLGGFKAPVGVDITDRVTAAATDNMADSSHELASGTNWRATAPAVVTFDDTTPKGREWMEPVQELVVATYRPFVNTDDHATVRLNWCYPTLPLKHPQRLPGVVVARLTAVLDNGTFFVGAFTAHVHDDVSDRAMALLKESPHTRSKTWTKMARTCRLTDPGDLCAWLLPWSCGSVGLNAGYHAIQRRPVAVTGHDSLARLDWISLDNQIGEDVEL